MPRLTLTILAGAAGTSLATVDRVINDRPGVSPRTRSRVLAAARALGYLPTDDAGVSPRPVRLLFLLPHGTNAFIADLRAHVGALAPSFPGVTAQIEGMDGFAPARLAERLFDLRRRNGRAPVDGVALVALDHPMVREALRQLLASGVPAVTIASDVLGVPHHGFIGIDNTQAGRLAGYLLGRFLGPRADGAAHKIAFFAGSLAYRGHQEREIGFRQILAEEFPALDLVERREVRDDRTLAAGEMADLLLRHPDLAGVYNAGGATSGLAAALTRAGRDRDTVVVAHDLTPGNKALLLAGTLDAVIDQNARVEVREALATLAAAARGEAYRMIPPRLQIILRENLPDA